MIWITGAAGLLGANLSRALLSNGHTVVGIDDLSGGYRESLPIHESFHFAQMDLNDYASLRLLAREFTPTTIYHFAAYAAEGLSPFIRRFNYMNNVVASASVINVALETDAKVIFTSSMAVYGAQSPPFDESLPRHPIDPYGIAKAAIEQDLECAASQHALRYTIVRPHNVVGRYQNIWDRYRNVLGIFIRRGLSGEPLIVFGDGSQERAFSDIRYMLAPLERMIDEGDGEISNLGSDIPISVGSAAELVTQVLERHGISAKVEFAEPRHEVHSAYCRHEKAQRELGFVDQTDLRSSVEDMVEWALEQPQRATSDLAYEIHRGLYSFWKT